MKVVVLGGAAAMAFPTIKFLAEFNEVSNLVIADINLEVVKSVAEKLDSDKVNAEFLNITDTESLQILIKDAKLVMNFVGPYYKFGTKPLETVINAGVNYIDIGDDYDYTIEALKLNEKAKELGVTAITGLGESPGITNILSKLGSDALDQTDEIHTNWIVGESNIGSESIAAFLHFFHCIDGKMPTFLNGNEKLIDAFRLEEGIKVKFDEPVGEAKVYQVAHPEPVTLPRFIPGVKTVTNRGGLIPDSQNVFFKILTDAGLTSDKPIEINGVSIKPQDFMFTALEKKLEENPEILETYHEDISSIQVEVKGMKDGMNASYSFTKTGKGSMAELTSIPAATGAKLILKGKIEEVGVLPPEALNPTLLINSLTEVGYLNNESDYKVERKIGNESKAGSIRDTKKFPEFYEKVKI